MTILASRLTRKIHDEDVQKAQYIRTKTIRSTGKRRAILLKDKKDLKYFNTKKN